MKRYMNLFRLLSVLLTVIAISPLRAFQQAALFDSNEALKHVRNLSSDAMEGRESSQRGYQKASEYAEKQLKSWGIEPAGENGTYFQKVPLDYFRISGRAGLEVILDQERQDFRYQDFWRILPHSGSCRGTFDVVFAGYGISAPQNGYDDYQGLDVSGKMVLISDKVPGPLAAKAGRGSAIEERIAAAKGHGARGILFFNNSFIVKQYLELWSKPFLFDEKFVLAALEDRTVDFMFQNMKKEGSSSLQEIAGTLHPSSYKMSCRISLSISTQEDPKAESRNVLAVIPGEDGLLKNEYIVISAHLDHIGISPTGEIMHGANDNASGSAVVLETARCLKAAGIKPRRTLIFALWAGEELGLLGSKYYSNHPLFPLDRTVANINMDMVGQGNDKVNIYGNSYFPELWTYLMDRLPKATRESVVPLAYSPGGSDHSSFQAAPYFKVHRSHDAIDFIDPEALKTAGRFVLDAVGILGFDSPNFITPRRREAAQLRRQTYLDFRLPVLNDAIKEPVLKDGIIDLKPVIVDGNAGLSGDALAMDILGNILRCCGPGSPASSYRLYSSVNDPLSADMRPGTMTLLAGVRGTKWMDENGQWGRHFRKNDLAFVMENGHSGIFTEAGMTGAGKERVNRLQSQGLAVILSDLTPRQTAGSLQAASGPLFLVVKDLPDDTILKLVQKTDSAVGLIYEDGDDPAAFMKKVEHAKKLIGIEHVGLYSLCSVETDKGRKELLDLMTLLISAEYTRKDLYYLFSGSFLRILCTMRGEEEPPVY